MYSSEEGSAEIVHEVFDQVAHFYPTIDFYKIDGSINWRCVFPESSASLSVFGSDSLPFRHHRRLSVQALPSIAFLQGASKRRIFSGDAANLVELDDWLALLCYECKAALDTEVAGGKRSPVPTLRPRLFELPAWFDYVVAAYVLFYATAALCLNAHKLYRWVTSSEH